MPYSGAMPSPQWALLGALFGAAAAGLLACIAWTVVATARRAEHRTASQIPDGLPQAVNALQHPVFVVDTAFVVQVANAAAVASGLVRDDALTMPELVDCATRVRHSEQFEQTEVIIRHRRGADSRFSVTASPLGARFILLIAVDHTAEDQTAEMRRDFTANFSHELKTPIAAALLLTEAMQAARDDPEQMLRFADSLHDQITHLDQLVHDILMLSSVESRTDRSSYQQVDVGEVVDEAVDACTVIAEQRRITLSASCPRPAYIWGDPQVLLAIVQNIVTNGIKYSQPGDHVGVGVERDHGRIKIIVTDKGMGIPLSEQERIFERFYRGDTAHSTTEGTGLGLSIALHGARVLGGDISVWSRPEIGSTFTITLPDATPVPSPSPSQGKLHVTHSAR